MRHYGVKIFEYGKGIAHFIETGSLHRAKQCVMGVDMNMDHANFYSETGYIMDSTFNRLKKEGKVA
jgi:hypothetical protein